MDHPEVHKGSNHSLFGGKLSIIKGIKIPVKFYAKNFSSKKKTNDKEIFASNWKW